MYNFRKMIQHPPAQINAVLCHLKNNRSQAYLIMGDLGNLGGLETGGQKADENKPYESRFQLM